MGDKNTLVSLIIIQNFSLLCGGSQSIPETCNSSTILHNNNKTQQVFAFGPLPTINFQFWPSKGDGYAQELMTYEALKGRLCSKGANVYEG